MNSGFFYYFRSEYSHVRAGVMRFRVRFFSFNVVFMTSVINYPQRLCSKAAQ